MYISRSKTIEILKKSGLVALKSDTIYGLSASIYAEQSLNEIFRIKNRSKQKPFITLFDSFSSVLPFIQPPNKQELAIINQHWPGSTTFILNRNTNQALNPLIHANKSTIAVRVPSNPDLSQILKETGPLVSTSINHSKQMSIQKVDEIHRFLGKKIGIYKGTNNSRSALCSTIFCFKRGVIRKGSTSIKGLNSFSSIS